MQQQNNQVDKDRFSLENEARDLYKVGADGQVLNNPRLKT